MPVDVESTVHIDAPRVRVAEFAAEPANAPDWYVNIRSAERLSQDPVGVGLRSVFVARFLGRELRYTYEIVEYVANERLVMRTSEGPFPMETTYTWADDGDGTQMTLRNRGEPSGFGRAAAPLMVPAMRRANTKDLARLKELLERR